MADNTRLNVGSGGDVYRSVDRSGVKTQVVLQDSLDALGYEQVTGLDTAKALTVPAGTLLAIITPSGQSVRWRDDGTNPTSSAGYPLSVGAELQYDSTDIASLKFIETAASATLDVCYYGVA